jgi:hypothetical protein
MAGERELERGVEALASVLRRRLERGARRAVRVPV